MIICENTAMKKGTCYIQVPFRYIELICNIFNHFNLDILAFKYEFVF